MPVFNILDAVIAVFNTVKAIPESLGPPPDPTKLVSAIVEMTKKVSKLLRLVPQLSLPYTILGVVDLILDTLGRLRDQLVFLSHSAQRLASLTHRAAELNDPGLAAVAACARANIEQEAANLSKGLGAVSTLLGILSIFTSMIGGPKVPDLSSLSGKPLDEAVKPLDDLVKTLQQLRSSVPVP
ncbi:MAG: hypothetical protein ACOZQL_41545 [Myxococcota bacterium]